MSVVAFKPRKPEPESPEVAKHPFETLSSEQQEALRRLVKLMAADEAEKYVGEVE